MHKVLLHETFQLMTPLNYIGTLYRIIQESFVNMENMFDLMEQKVWLFLFVVYIPIFQLDASDQPGCQKYVKTEKSPEIEFKCCNFGYSPCKPLLK